MFYRLTKKGDIHYEALVTNLKPHTAYMIRIAAINEIDRSAYTEPVVVKTQEEGTTTHILKYLTYILKRDQIFAHRPWYEQRYTCFGNTFI